MLVALRQNFVYLIRMEVLLGVGYEAAKFCIPGMYGSLTWGGLRSHSCKHPNAAVKKTGYPLYFRLSCYDYDGGASHLNQT